MTTVLMAVMLVSVLLLAAFGGPWLLRQELPHWRPCRVWPRPRSPLPR